MEGVKRLIIVRHGNTFAKGETPTRVGAKTDLPLVEEERARSVGRYLLAKGFIPNRVYAAPLKRTMQTAQLAVEELQSVVAVTPIASFVEIDYGPDENKTEEQVMGRLGRYYLTQEGGLSDATSLETIMQRGEQAIDLWNLNATAPDGWKVDVDKIVETWRSFANDIKDGETVMLVSSNGIIRFAPYVLSVDYGRFCSENDIKVVTGGVCIFEYANGEWVCSEWNSKPYKQYQ